jgi:nucleotide-binding universal stress UspA family protein
VARIVVGVDASRGALRALAWAADEARLRLASLQVEGVGMQRGVLHARRPVERPEALP